jgi:ribose 1,5-bisphosphokinase
MSRTLIYTMGPSGAGKDSVLGWLKAHLPPDAAVHFARRCITRQTYAVGEQHEALTGEEFAQAHNASHFGLHWAANGLHYGVRWPELQGPPDTQWIIINGSRAHLPEACQQYPGLVALHIGASPEVLHTRLLARGRETSAEVQARLTRMPPLFCPQGTKLLEIHNNTRLQDAGHQLLLALRSLPGWSTGQ